MIKTRGVNHIAIRISDVARASEFYGKLLGLTVVPFPTMDRDKAAEFRDAVVSSKNVSGLPVVSGSRRAARSFI